MFSRSYIQKHRIKRASRKERLTRTGEVHISRTINMRNIPSVRCYERCLDCDKRGYSSEEHARRAIAHLIATRSLTGEGTYAMEPYLCPHGFWHIGRNMRTRQIIEEYLRTGRLPVHPKKEGAFGAPSGLGLDSARLAPR
jgi:hypothetical protein